MIPGGYCQDRGERAAPVYRGLETISELSYDSSLAVQKLPTFRPIPHTEKVSCGERGNGPMYRMARGSISSKAQEDVSKAEPLIAAIKFGGRRRKSYWHRAA